MKKFMGYFLFTLICFNSLAQELGIRTVIIDEASCNYDQYGLPKILIRIAPAIKFENKLLDTFVGGSNLDLCPDMENISNRLYIPVKFNITDYQYFYKFDEHLVCNYYQGILLNMYIPVPTNQSKNVFATFTPLESKLINPNVNPNNCSFHDDY